MFAEKFDSRTLANMEVALERASKLLKQRSEQHEFRSYVASKILEHAEHGDKTLEGLTEAGSTAARELRLRSKPDCQPRKTSARSQDK
ncbi:MAG: hypothetical protein H0V72_07755 [Bradyrhizobium sp.]|nr:hypothetical protein [Bradyrhizobium sp.]